MKKRFIVGNWKAHHTISETKDWLEKLVAGKERVEQTEEVTVIVCPPFTALSDMKRFRDEYHLPFYLGAQTVSQFETGAYTGEIAPSIAKELTDYVILGHSERREHFSETDELLREKVAAARAVGFTVIFCVQGKDTPIPEGVDIVAYEPIFAIGSGTPDTPENAEDVASSLKQKGIQIVLYGGSVTPENIHNFTEKPSIDGVLVGGASLKAESFLALIQNS